MRDYTVRTRKTRSHTRPYDPDRDVLPPQPPNWDEFLLGVAERQALGEQMYRDGYLP